MSERVKTEYVDKLESGLNSPIAVSANNLEQQGHARTSPPSSMLAGEAKCSERESGNDEGVAVGQSVLRRDAQTQTNEEDCHYGERDWLDISFMNDQQLAVFSLLKEMFANKPRSPEEEIRLHARFSEASRLAVGRDISEDLTANSNST